MNNPLNKSSLSLAQRRLVELMQALGFGRIERLAVRAGEPVFEPAPRVIRKLKMGAENGPRRELFLPDFRLRQEVVELLGTIADLSEGEIISIDIRDGLPFAMEVEQQSAEGECTHG